MAFSCVPRIRNPFYFYLYHTTCVIHVLDPMAAVEDLLWNCYDIAHHIREVLDFYDPMSQLSILNSAAQSGRPVSVSEELFAFLAEMRKTWAISGGAFDPGLGELSRLWDFTAENPHVPGDQRRRALAENSGMRFVRLDAREQSVVFLRSGLTLDGGGAGKGYAAMAVTEYLRSRGVKKAYVNFGGNISLLGADGDCWNVTIQAPFMRRGELIGTLALPSVGVATSGSYDRCFVEGNTVYHHLLEPKTGKCVRNALASVTVVCTDAWKADMFSTALFVAGTEGASTFVERMDGLIGYIYIFENGEIQISESLRDRFIPNVNLGGHQYEHAGY